MFDGLDLGPDALVIWPGPHNLSRVETEFLAVLADHCNLCAIDRPDSGDTAKLNRCDLRPRHEGDPERRVEDPAGIDADT